MIRTFTAIFATLFLAVSGRAQGPAAARASQIPVREGLTIVAAYRNATGDYESIRQINHIDAKSVTVTLSTDQPPENQQGNPIAELLGGNCRDAGASHDPERRWTVVRKVRREDLETAHAYRQEFIACTGGEDFHPGSTAVGFSASVMRELKARGQTSLSVTIVGGPAAAFSNMIGQLLGGDSKELEQAAMTSGVLTRVEPMAVPFNVIVNDEPTQLAAVHARWRATDQVLEYWVLDNAANPLVLRAMKPNGSFQLQVIKLSYPYDASGTAPAPSIAGKIERDLAKEGRTVVYGIYFDFASDRLKPESDAVLVEIATVLRKNPTWSLAVEGHTDNIGGNASNLDLSTRRAAAVKQSLVARHHIDGKRLQTNGYGASRPKDANDTIEGRARNRRVELVKTE